MVNGGAADRELSPWQSIQSEGPGVLSRIGSGLTDTFNYVSTTAPQFTKWMTFGLTTIIAYAFSSKASNWFFRSVLGMDGNIGGIMTFLLGLGIAGYVGNGVSEIALKHGRDLRGEINGGGGRSGGGGSTDLSGQYKDAVSPDPAKLVEDAKKAQASTNPETTDNKNPSTKPDQPNGP